MNRLIHRTLGAENQKGLDKLSVQHNTALKKIKS